MSIGPPCGERHFASLRSDDGARAANSSVEARPETSDRRAGWSDDDIADLDRWLAHVIAGSVAQFRRTRHGTPASLTDHEWDRILSTIVAGMDDWTRVDTTSLDAHTSDARARVDIDEALQLLGLVDPAVGLAGREDD